MALVSERAGLASAHWTRTGTVKTGGRLTTAEPVKFATVDRTVIKKQATITPAPQPCNSATSPPAPARGGPSLTWLRRMGSLSCMGTCVDGGRGGVLCADVVGSLQFSVFFAATSKLPAGGCKQAARLVHRAGQPTPWVTLVRNHPASHDRPRRTPSRARLSV